jgi:hypothetical protein
VAFDGAGGAGGQFRLEFGPPDSGGLRKGEDIVRSDSELLKQMDVGQNGRPRGPQMLV